MNALLITRDLSTLLLKYMAATALSLIIFINLLFSLMLLLIYYIKTLLFFLLLVAMEEALSCVNYCLFRVVFFVKIDCKPWLCRQSVRLLTFHGSLAYSIYYVDAIL